MTAQDSLAICQGFLIKSIKKERPEVSQAESQEVINSLAHKFQALIQPSLVFHRLPKLRAVKIQRNSSPTIAFR